MSRADVVERLAPKGFPEIREDTALSRRDAKQARQILLGRTSTPHDPQSAATASVAPQDPDVVDPPDSVAQIGDRPPRWPERLRSDSVAHLSVAEVEHIHTALTEEFRGTADAVYPPGVKDPSALESAVNRPIAGAMRYRTVALSAAALMHSLINNHPFHNGNKRTALIATAMFVEERNGRYLNVSENDLYVLVVQTASHTLEFESKSRGRQHDPYYSEREVLAIFRILNRGISTPDQSDRHLQWRELEGILRHFGCRVDPIQHNQTKIHRTMADGCVLSAVAGARNAGAEISKQHIRKYRRDLRLTKEHGIDSATFYGKKDPHPKLPEIIKRYRGVLERLSLLDRQVDELAESE